MSETVLECIGLNKSYAKGISVLNGFSYTAESGRIIGLLGPNGCGKSTLMKLITGLLVPDGGEIRICGEPRSESSNRLISYLPERTYFNSWMKVDNLTAFFEDFYPDFDRKKALSMLKDMGIDPSAHLKQLSKGNKEKMQLILVMSRKARLYLLDEPIGGVDPAARDYILRTIIGNYAPDSTVILSTHLIHDIEPILDDFVFMGYGGKLLLSGNADDVRSEKGKSLDELFREVYRC